MSQEKIAPKIAPSADMQLTSGPGFWYHTALLLERWQSLVECT